MTFPSWYLKPPKTLPPLEQRLTVLLPKRKSVESVGESPVLQVSMGKGTVEFLLEERVLPGKVYKLLRSLPPLSQATGSELKPLAVALLLHVSELSRMTPSAWETKPMVRFVQK